MNCELRMANHILNKNPNLNENSLQIYCETKREKKLSAEKYKLKSNWFDFLTSFSYECNKNEEKKSKKVNITASNVFKWYKRMCNHAFFLNVDLSRIYKIGNSQTEKETLIPLPFFLILYSIWKSWRLVKTESHTMAKTKCAFWHLFGIGTATKLHNMKTHRHRCFCSVFNVCLLLHNLSVLNKTKKRHGTMMKKSKKENRNQKNKIQIQNEVKKSIYS